MSGTDWAALLGAIIPMLLAIGGGFAWLINMIVSQSKEAVAQLRLTNDTTATRYETKLTSVESERDEWRDRALACEAKGAPE